MEGCCHNIQKNEIAINTEFLNYLVIKSGITSLDEYENIVGKKLEVVELKKEVDFKPGNIGEGKAPKDELSYRQMILFYLKPVYEEVNKIIEDTKTDIPTKISKIDKLIDTFIFNTQNYVRTTITSRFWAGWNRFNSSATKRLKELKKTPVAVPKKHPRLDSVLNQQMYNIEDIGLFLRGKLRQFLTMKDIGSYYLQKSEPIKKEIILKEAVPNSNWTSCMKRLHKQYPKWTESELRKFCEQEDIDRYFNDSSKRLDMLGMFGYVTSDKLGYLGASILTMSVLSVIIKIPWLTCEDKGDCSSETPVCDDCLFCASNGPYEPLDYPEDQHFGERCSPGEPIIDLMSSIAEEYVGVY